MHKAIRIRRGDAGDGDGGRDRVHGGSRPCAEGRPHVPLPGAVRRGDRRGRARRGAPRRGAGGAHRPPHRRAPARAPRRGEDHRALADAPHDAGDATARRRRWSRWSASPPRVESARGGSWASRRRGSTRARAPRVSCAAAPQHGSSRPGSPTHDVERILELVPLATHNQRGRGTLYVGTEQELDAEDLVRVVERSMSAPVLRAAEAARRALRRRARAPPAAVRGGLRAARAQGRARDLRRTSTTATSCCRGR